jgi:hypothetical protein
MELDFDLEQDAQMDLYCDVLVRYLLVGSALGECDLQRRMGGALDSGDTEALAAALRQFEALPEDLKARILEGDPMLATELDTSRRTSAHDSDEPPARARPVSA